MMGTNYIGAFSLTKLLLPLLKNSPIGSRIVNVTSFTHRNRKDFYSHSIWSIFLRIRWLVFRHLFHRLSMVASCLHQRLSVMFSMKNEFCNDSAYFVTCTRPHSVWKCLVLKFLFISFFFWEIKSFFNFFISSISSEECKAKYFVLQWSLHRCLIKKM
jgi:hypothetical protein